MLLLAAVPVHLALSLGWALLLARVLPRRHTVAWATAAGLAIAALDLGVVGRRFPRIRALPLAAAGARPRRLRGDGRRGAQRAETVTSVAFNASSTGSIAVKHIV